MLLTFNTLVTCMHKHTHAHREVWLMYIIHKWRKHGLNFFTRFVRQWINGKFVQFYTFVKFMAYKNIGKKKKTTLKLCTSTAGGLGLIPSWGTKIPHAVCCRQKNEKYLNHIPLVPLLYSPVRKRQYFIPKLRESYLFTFLIQLSSRGQGKGSPCAQLYSQN